MATGVPSSVPQPSDEESFQPERTGLAWNRTLVVLAVAFGILGVHALHDGVHVAATTICAALAAIVLVVSSPFARARAREARDMLAGSTRMTSPMPLLLLSAVASLLALASLALIVMRG